MRSDSPDVLNDAAARTRWMGNLFDAEKLASRALAIGLSKDLDDPVHDWVERIARSSFELANTALWQGRHREVEEICRGRYMQTTGGKWAAWDLTLQSAVAVVRGDFIGADRLADEALTLVKAQDWTEAWPSVYLAQAQNARIQGRLALASECQQKALQCCSDYPQMKAMVEMEGAEILLAKGETETALLLIETLAHCGIPIIEGLMLLRLAEQLPGDVEEPAMQALELLSRVGCLWGIRRATKLLEQRGRDAELVGEVLVPTMCVPGGVWVF